MESSKSITFNQLNQDYISKLKDAFQMIDDDGDGIIQHNDLKKILQNVGKNVADEDVENMLKKANGSDSGISFPEFLSLMSSTTGEFPEEEELIECLQNISDVQDSNMNITIDTLIKQLKEAGFENPEEEFDKIFKTFSSKQQTTNQILFKGQQFLNTISER